MGDWPSGLSGGRIMGATYALQAHASANIKGSWVQFFSSTLYDAILYGSHNLNNADNYLIDIAIGAAGSEAAIIDNLIATDGIACHINSPFIYPIFIPKGSRVSARTQCTTGAAYYDLSLYLVPIDNGSVAPLSSCVTYGANVADSGGTSIDPGSTINTKGAWVQLTAASTRRTKSMVIGVGNQNNVSRAYAFWYIDIGVTSDKNIIIPSYCARTNVVYGIHPYVSMPFPVDIPAGSEIHVRASCNINDAADRLFDVTLYCFG